MRRCLLLLLVATVAAKRDPLDAMQCEPIRIRMCDNIGELEQATEKGAERWARKCDLLKHQRSGLRHSHIDDCEKGVSAYCSGQIVH